jgi:hypothetical protein
MESPLASRPGCWRNIYDKLRGYHRSRPARWLPTISYHWYSGLTSVQTSQKAPYHFLPSVQWPDICPDLPDGSNYFLSPVQLPDICLDKPDGSQPFPTTGAVAGCLAQTSQIVPSHFLLSVQWPDICPDKANGSQPFPNTGRVAGYLPRAARWFTTRSYEEEMVVSPATCSRVEPLRFKQRNGYGSTDLRLDISTEKTKFN